MKYTAAQLRLMRENKWGWASRGEEPPPPPPPKPKKVMTRAERNKRLRDKRDTYLRAQYNKTWLDALLNKQRRASGKPEIKPEETPESSAETIITSPEESEYTAEAWPWDDGTNLPLSDDWD